MPGFISNNQNGEESKTAERQREKECMKVKDSFGHKIDLWRKRLVTDMCN